MANINSAVLSERSRSILSEGIPKRGAPVYVELYRKILQLIREGEFAPGDMLPGEECLAELTGTGRSSVRSALMLLCEDGYTQTRRGRGTFVIQKENGNGHIPVPERYLLPRERVNLQLGGAKVLYSSSRKNSFDEFLDAVLQAHGQSVNILIRAYGTEEPAVISYVYFREDLLSLDGLTDDEAEFLLTEVFRKRVTSVDATLSPAYSAEMYHLRLGKDVPNRRFLLSAAVWLDAGGAPLAYCKDYYNCDIMRFRQRFPL